MIRLALVGAVIGCLFECEQRFSGTPARQPWETANTSPSGGLDALLRPSAGDAEAPAPVASHAMIVSSCSWAPQECSGANADASMDAMYHVVFGSGRGVVRTREQAMTDLYRELRDRLEAGEQLTVRPRPPGDAGTGAAWRGRSTSNGPSTQSSDAVAQSAMRLLDAVDAANELLVDVDHTSRSSCLLSLVTSLGDGGASQCLINEPERSQHRARGGLSF